MFLVCRAHRSSDERFQCQHGYLRSPPRVIVDLPDDVHGYPRQENLELTYQKMANSSTAEQADERLLALDPWFALAASNLAARLSRTAVRRRRPLELARRAEEADPGRSAYLGHPGLDSVRARRLPASRQSARGEHDKTPKRSGHPVLLRAAQADRDAVRGALT
jgi:hypothetical protein